MNQSDVKKLIYSISEIERKVLPNLLNTNSIEEVAKLTNISESEATTAIQLLEQREITQFIKEESTFVELDKFGEQYVNSELPEVQVLNLLKVAPKNLDTIPRELISSAMGELKKNQLINSEKKGNKVLLTITPKALEFLKSHSNPLKKFKIKIKINKLTKEQHEILQALKQRKGYLKESIKKTFSFKLTKGGETIVQEVQKNYKNIALLETLTPEMIKSKSWKGKEFRHYNINVPTTISEIGRKHPMLEANEILSKIFIEMGFKEMSGPLVDSAFWNMDTMWIPQDHPARDEQDTFYLEDSCELPKEYVKQVKNMHEVGIKKTHTSRGDFSEEISSKQLLRTHSTATSFRTLHELSKKHKKGENINGKYFYLANVFRNEAIDATHLAEFYQGEGFIIGDNLSLADLMGFIKVYLSKLGFDNIKFKPTFNPYTEPSMEAHYYDPEIGKSYALINSGIFRSETLKPLGLENKTIIAWGFGASRLAAKLANKQSMRDITGATCDLEWLKTRPQMQRTIGGGN
jgi:phenylalanyl-tRNA synthetase alpha chain